MVATKSKGGRLQAPTGKAPSKGADVSCDALLARIKERLSEAADTGKAGLGELAQALRVLNEIKREELEQAQADRVQVVYYIPERIMPDAWEQLLNAACPSRKPSPPEGGSPGGAK